MSTKFWKTVSVIFLVLWCGLGFHGIIRTYKEGKYWSCSFYAVSEYLLLNVTKDIINTKVDEDEPENKGGEE